LRLKESDRIESVCNMLSDFSVEVDCTDDSIIVYGTGMNTTLTPRGKVQSANDHRIVMTAAILATRAANEVVLTDEFAVNKSYPNFFEDYATFGGMLQ
jgi:3-phosphoshikimate 1-carboxyvinyltransferase